MYKVKHKGPLLAAYAFLILLISYLITSIQSFSNSYHKSVVGNIYVSTSKDFFLEFLSETQVKRYTDELIDVYDYIKVDGVYYIDAQIELQGVALNNANEFYIETTNTYMFRIN